MANILDKIVAVKKDEVATLYETYSLSYYRELAEASDLRKSFYDAINQSGVSLIAELKKASPSKGVIRPDFEPVSLAKQFTSSGASALSVLTDESFFQGSLSNLMLSRDAVSTPLLRKEFIIDPIQIYEAKSAGASAVLLIASILDNTLAQSLINTANDCELDVLMEIHNETELTQISKLEGLNIVGVNNRNLSTFTTDINTVLSLAPKIREVLGEELCVVAESGYSSPDQINILEENAINAVLIGEGLARHSDLLSYWSSKNNEEY